jgi:hypothetical protein
VFYEAWLAEPGVALDLRTSDVTIRLRCGGSSTCV